MKVLIGRDELPNKRLVARLLWEPRDVWLGVYWNRVRAGAPADRFLLIYVCVIPCIPLAFAWRLRTPLPASAPADKETR
jgi:hypothetical protein